VASALALIRARRALAEAGLDPDVTIERASSVNNEVWLTPNLVIRMNLQPDQRLRREATLAAALPSEIGYPPVVAYGGDMGSEWLLLERIPGQPLSRCWPDLTLAQRRLAISQLAARLKVLHGCRAPVVAELHKQPQLLDHAATGAAAVRRLRAAIERAATLEHVDPRKMGELDTLVAATASCLEPFDADTLVHGDLTFENMLWDGSQLTALLDFEWARPGPPDLDLDVLMRFVAYPFLHVAADYEHRTLARDYCDVPQWLAEDYPELFEVPRQFERVRLYSIAWDVQELLRFPPAAPAHELNEHHPYRRIGRTLGGLSHIDRFHNSVTVA
jgi:hygromycin-B 7''-O-kinase